MSSGGNLPDFRTHLYLRGKRDEAVRKVLAQMRKNRPYPFIDRKLQTGWNALLAHALFTAAALDPRYARLGRETVDAILKELVQKGRLMHQKLPGKAPKVPALLEDYSFLVSALIDAYEASYESRYLRKAQALLDEAKRRFRRDGRWMDAEGNFSNPLDLEGGSYRSALAVLALDYLRLAALDENREDQATARQILRSRSAVLREYPTAAPTAVLAADALRRGYVVLKAPRDRIAELRREAEGKLDYPFLLFKAVEDPLYQACRIDRCFVYEHEMMRFVSKLQKRLK
ncbi:hypothetical protein [Nitratifractor sp.]